MRYTAFLVLGIILLTLQGQVFLVTDPIANILPSGSFAWTLVTEMRPSLLVPLLVFLGVTETNLALGAGVAFLLGYVLDVVAGAPIGLHAFTSVATVALARIAGLRIVTQGGWARALLAGAFAAFGAVVALVLLAIFGRPYVPRALLRLVIPHALATAVVAPLVYRLAEKTQALASGFLGRQPDAARRSIDGKLATPAASQAEPPEKAP
jgi:rod shape-determining protein MreD